MAKEIKHENTHNPQLLADQIGELFSEVRAKEENYIQELKKNNETLKENLRKCREERRKKGQSCHLLDRRKNI